MFLCYFAPLSFAGDLLELISIHCISKAISDLKLKCLLCCVTGMILCFHSLTLPMVWPLFKFHMARLWNACTSTTETVCRTPSMYSCSCSPIIYLLLCPCKIELYFFFLVQFGSFINLVVCRMPLGTNRSQISVGVVLRCYSQMLVWFMLL